MTTTTAARIMTAGLALAALTACGNHTSGDAAGSSTGPGGQQTSPAAATPTSTDATAAASNGTDNGLDVCRVLPTADVSQITGVTYTKVRPSSVEGQIFECEYTNAQFGLLQVSVTTINGSLAYDADLQAMSGIGKAPTPVSGVGDKAFSTPAPKGDVAAAGASAFASYGALFGDQYVKIGGSSVTSDQGRQIVEEIHAAL